MSVQSILRQDSISAQETQLGNKHKNCLQIKSIIYKT